ncbi:beta-lactamase regulating signal transducer with metallopeptidase domain [Pelomonas saccharophila]|uniref:Beta-lactamase regulating signal transducer with metallopeptidase domain n=1 Tax=Roseateles saccharophilus TaxID=304 RepID=A0ABU1YMB3_ROSSA|nr:M56 family metallopeptidase [Roseateles saccharophilus]MDR7270001.1 beta-lactamase regulating signal transducer with metallopeptidase domain [Roseateles saccharophilus]
MTDVLLTWLCSYLLHSSLLIAGLWAAERAGWLAGMATSTQETLWRLALLGGLVSASLPLLPAASTAPADTARPVVVAQQVAAQPTDVRPLVVEAPAAAQPSAQLGALPIATSLAPKAHDLAVGFVAAWLAGAVLMLLGLALQWAWLRRAVCRLPELADARWHGLAEHLAADMRVPLPALRHARAGWASPLLAPGRVLCLPAWCLDLPDDEARAVLGHELAHLRRRDPAWRLLAAVIKALLWPQALNRIALQRLDLLAELACDAAAAQPSGQRLALAQSLLRCAEALKAQGGRHGPALACGAASAGSPLLARVRRLLRSDDETPRERRGVRWGLVGIILVALVAMPAVVVSHTDGRSLLERLDFGGLGDSMAFSVRGTRIYSRYPGGSFAVVLDGKVAFNDAEDEVQTLTGTLTVKEREGGLTREMVLKSMGEGRIEREYRVGNDSRPLDEAGRQWWGKAVQRMAESLTDPLVRARKLFARGGIDAVLADIESAREDFQRRRRIESALKLDGALPVGAVERLITASAGLQGAFERREALSAIARQPLTEPQQLAWLAAAAGIDGDFERREALAALAPRLLTSPAVLAAWGQAVGHIGGDFELRSAIEAQVSATPQPAVLAAALQAATHIEGDFEKREALGAVVQRLQGDEADLVDAYARAAGGIGGGFERREALNKLLDRPRLGTAGLERVLASAESMEGGFERLQVLLRVAEKLGQSKPVDAALIERLRRAGRGMGDHERGQIENALDRLS